MKTILRNGAIALTLLAGSALVAAPAMADHDRGDWNHIIGRKSGSTATSMTAGIAAMHITTVTTIGITVGAGRATIVPDSRSTSARTTDVFGEPSAARGGFTFSARPETRGV
jgi:hypothetical protein